MPSQDESFDTCCVQPHFAYIAINLFRHKRVREFLEMLYKERPFLQSITTGLPSFTISIIFSPLSDHTFWLELSFLPLVISDAKAMASSYECKYAETSASLNHNVDELLVGILTQIRLKLAEKTRFGRRKGPRGPSTLSATAGAAGGQNPVTRRKSAGVRVKGILDKVLGGDSKSKSCDDLHVL